MRRRVLASKCNQSRIDRRDAYHSLLKLEPNTVSFVSFRHKLAKQRDVCRNTKWMMLHVRDCPGTTSTFDVCPFPWCRKVKHLLYHLVTCQESDQCTVCCPTGVPSGLAQLHGLNQYRLKKYRERLIARVKAIEKARDKSPAKSGKTTVSRSADSPVQPEAESPAEASTATASAIKQEQLPTDPSPDQHDEGDLPSQERTEDPVSSSDTTAPNDQSTNEAAPSGESVPGSDTATTASPVVLKQPKLEPQNDDDCEDVDPSSDEAKAESEGADPSRAREPGATRDAGDAQKEAATTTTKTTEDEGEGEDDKEGSASCGANVKSVCSDRREDGAAGVEAAEATDPPGEGEE